MTLDICPWPKLGKTAHNLSKKLTTCHFAPRWELVARLFSLVLGPGQKSNLYFWVKGHHQMKPPGGSTSHCSSYSQLPLLCPMFVCLGSVIIPPVIYLPVFCCFSVFLLDKDLCGGGSVVTRLPQKSNDKVQSYLFGRRTSFVKSLCPGAPWEDLSKF